jgi:hypothetical protein
MSKTFRAWKIDDPLLLPVAVRDFVDEKHLATFVLNVVKDELDLAKIMACYSSEKVEGRADVSRAGDGERVPGIAAYGANLGNTAIRGRWREGFVRKHCQGERDERHESQHGVHGVRVLPLAACCLKAVRHHSPIVACDVHRVGERPENCLRDAEADSAESDNQKVVRFECTIAV